MGSDCVQRQMCVRDRYICHHFVIGSFVVIVLLDVVYAMCGLCCLCLLLAFPFLGMFARWLIGLLVGLVDLLWFECS